MFVRYRLALWVFVGAARVLDILPASRPDCTALSMARHVLTGVQLLAGYSLTARAPLRCATGVCSRAPGPP